jgi:ABC-type Mn2+/Zn2+ transport system permease subunit
MKMNQDAKKIAHQIVASFIISMLLEANGWDGTNLIPTLVILFLFMGVSYFCLVIKAVNASKEQWAFRLGVVFALLLALGVISEVTDGSFEKYNIFDWLSSALSFIQTGLIYYVYSLVRTNRKSPHL